ncbi:MAG: dTDP-4-dehydrorhamnose reductase [Endomicrobiaceae bacterium]|nr:dTDP-4-dehydrorhamnose reductase [Endomicrobiaceae bacterium]
MRVLIAGYPGQLAKSFISALTRMNIVFLTPPHYDFDITNNYQISSMISAFKPDVILNCAAYNNVEHAEEDMADAIAVNYKAVENLVKEAELHKIKLVHFSTDYVFDGKKNDWYFETDNPNPLNLYGKSKLAGENEALQYENSLIFRLSWVIGYGRNNFLYKFTNWIKDKQSVKVSNDEISVPTFTFDIAKYVLMAIDKDLTGLYHLTNSGKASRYELASKYTKLMGFTNEIVPVPMSAFEVPIRRPLVTAMSNRKISEALGVNIPNWEDSLRIYCNNIKNNIDLIK